MPDFATWSFGNQKVIVLALALTIFAAACASIQTPMGGPKDRTPPVVEKETPKNLTKNFKSKKIEIQFNEYFKLNDEFRQISISPAFENMPEFKVKNKSLEITFKDSLQANTTYTINFGKAIADYNEGNILKNYSYVFSTGNIIDSLSISGNVIDAIAKKPAIETTVLIVPSNRDTLFTRQRASLFTQTDSSGNFRMNNLKSGIYHIFALKEPNGGDRIYNSANEEIAFLKDSIVLDKNISDINLTLFKETPKDFRILSRNTQADGKIILPFNRPLDSPTVRLLDQPDLDKKKYVEFSREKDSVSIWLPAINFDSLKVEIADKGIPLDTTKINISKTFKPDYTVAVGTNTVNSQLRENSDLLLRFSNKLENFNPLKITLLEDSIPADREILIDPQSSRNLRIKYNWKKKKNYIIKLDENAVTGISGGRNKLFTEVFILDSEDKYASLSLIVKVPDSIATRHYVVQLIRNETEAFMSRSISTSQTLTFPGLSPGKYGVRVIYDDNNNGKWDTGNLEKKQQPEPIWNFNGTYSLRARQDLNQPLTIPAVP